MLLTTTELIETSWRVYTKNWRALLPYLMLLFIPSLALFVLGLVGIYLDEILPSAAMAGDAVIVVLKIISFLLVFWVTIGLMRAISALALGAAPEFWRTNLNQAAPLLWPAIYTAILAGLVIIGGTILFIVPGIIFAVWYLFVSYAVVLDNKKGASALRESKRLVIGRWWQIAVRFIIPLLLFGLAAALLRGILSQLVFYAAGYGVAFSLVSNTLRVVINTLIIPLNLGVAILLYHSAKQNPHFPEPAPPMAK